MRPRRADPHTLAGAYAADAVTAADRAAFERHLARCDACRQEIAGLREAAARLGAAAAVEPPAALRESVLRAVARTRQLPPAVAGRRRTSRLASGQVRHREMLRGGMLRGGAFRGWPARLAVALAGVLVALAVVFGLVGHGMQHRLDQAQRHARAVAAVLSAPDATMLTGRVRTGGAATVVMSHRHRALVFTASGLRALPATKRYELWLMGPAGDRPAGMLPWSARTGSAGPMVVSGLATDDRVCLTVEPATGSARPTLPPVLMLSLSG